MYPSGSFTQSARGDTSIATTGGQFYCNTTGLEMLKFAAAGASQWGGLAGLLLKVMADGFGGRFGGWVEDGDVLPAAVLVFHAPGIALAGLRVSGQVKEFDVPFPGG